MSAFEASVFQFVKAGEIDNLNSLFSSSPLPLSLNFRDEARRTPLHWAVEAKNLPIIKLLLASGARPKGIDSEGYTALHMAIWKKSSDIVEVLLEAGADTNFCSENSVYAGYTSLHIACHQNSEELVRLLLDHKAKVHPTDAGQTPLHIACDHGFSSAISRMLLRADDSQLNATDQNGFTALTLACSKDKTEIVAFLLSLHGIDIFAADNNGDTALHHALKVPLQRLFQGGFAVLPVAQSVAYSVVRAAANRSAEEMKKITEVKNVFGADALEFEAQSFSTLLRTVESEVTLRSNFPTLENLLSTTAADLKHLGVPAAVADSVAELLTAVRKEQDETVLREEGKGGCPFIEAKNRSSGPPSTKAAAAAAAAATVPVGSTPASAGAPSSIAAHATAGGDISQCPFFNSALKKKSPATDSAVASSSSSSASASTTRAVDPSVEKITVASGGKCPIPFHNQLASPSFWMLAGCVVLVAYVSTRLMRAETASTPQ